MAFLRVQITWNSHKTSTSESGTPNNRTILHGRTDYEDTPEIATRRHMLRLWLQMPTWPPLPANQGMQSPADYPLWLRQRTPFMEVPTRYLAEMTRRKAELAA